MYKNGWVLNMLYKYLLTLYYINIINTRCIRYNNKYDIAHGTILNECL